MKTIFNTLAVIFAISATSSSKAAIFDIYIASPNFIHPKQQNLGMLSGQSIVIDTKAETLTMTFETICDNKITCPDYMKTADLSLISLDSERAEVSKIVASGELPNGKQMTVTIIANADHATDITISESNGCKSLESRFTGSAVTRLRSRL